MTDQEIKEMAAKLEIEKATLEPVFNRLHDPADWKAPIDAFCRREERAVVARAIEFFTATQARFSEPYPASKGWLRVQADGYRRGPAGDH